MKAISTSLFFLAILLILQSCKKAVKKKDDEGFPMVRPLSDEDYNIMTNKVITKGDTNAYYELFYLFGETVGCEDSIMYYSEIMAKKYEYKRAFFDYQYGFHRKYEIDLSHDKYNKSDIAKMNKKGRAMILEWYDLMYKRGIITKNERDSCLLGQ
jgi:hypothetical protein